MRFAAIDLGTQTFRLALAEVGTSGLVEPLGTYLYNARLGNSLIDGHLGPEVIKALKEIRERCESYQLDGIRACGTEAVRRLKDLYPSVFSKLVKTLGQDVRVLKPQEEGRLTATGVRASLGGSRHRILILDVGGGSTEAIFCKDDETIVKSVPLGAVNFSRGGLSALSFLTTPPFSKAEEVVTTGGTATTLAAIIKGLQSYRPWEIRGLRIDRDEIENLLTRLSSMTLEERRQVPGLEPERADIIIPGLEILLSALKYKGTSAITISDGGLLMGILVDLIKKELKDHAQLDWRRLYV